MRNRNFTSVVLIVLLLILSTAALSAETKSEKIDKTLKEYYDAHRLTWDSNEDTFITWIERQ